MSYWIAAQNTYNTATDKFDRAVSTRAFSLLFFALAGLITVFGLAINFGITVSPVILPALILVAAVFWLPCLVLQDKRAEIQEWFRIRFPASYTVLPSKLDASFRSVTSPSEDRPPRSTPHA